MNILRKISTAFLTLVLRNTDNSWNVTIPTTAEQYRLEWTTPATYEDGFETIEVEVSAEEQILQKVSDGIYTVEDLLKVVAAKCGGKTTIVDLGGGNATVTFRNLGDIVDRIVGDMTGSVRTNVTITP